MQIQRVEYWITPQHYQERKLNNWTSVTHYSLGVSFKYSLLVPLATPISSCFLVIIHNP